MWTQAHPSVTFMTIDAGGLWLGMIFLVAIRDGLVRAGIALLLSPVLGPGAAPALVLSRRQAEKSKTN